MIVLHIQIVTKVYRLYFLNLIGMHLLNYSQGHLKSTSISFLFFFFLDILFILFYFLNYFFIVVDFVIH